MLVEQLKQYAQPSPQEAKRRDSKSEEKTKSKEEKMKELIEQHRMEEEER